MLNMMIRASGSSLRIRRINSKPETAGSLMSMTVTSGFRVAYARCPDFASAASSIFTEGSDANSERQPDRTPGGSSTFNTRVVDLKLFCIIEISFRVDRFYAQIEKGK